MIIILSALKEEIKPIMDELDITEKIVLRPSIIFKGEYMGREVIVSHTGVGIEKMRRAAEFCIKEYQPSLCINMGYCGALTPMASLADLIIPDSVVYENSTEQFLITSNLGDKIKNICAGLDLKYHTGQILTAAKVISTPHEKAYLGTKFGAIAVDMESAGLAMAARKSKICLYW